MLRATDRQRRKNEALAQQIFGKNRRASTPSNGVRKPGTGQSLASRVGITKVGTTWAKDTLESRLITSTAVRIIYSETQNHGQFQWAS